MYLNKVMKFLLYNDQTPQNHEIRPFLKEYQNNGFTSASKMLEYASSDFAIGQFALKAIKSIKDANYFTNRSQNWKNKQK